MESYYTYIVTYTFEESHVSIREAFRAFLESNDNSGLGGDFCDESTYGLLSSKSVSEMQSVLSQKLRVLYDQEHPASHDVVNLFCAALQADSHVQTDKSTKDRANTIYRYAIVCNGRFMC